MLFRSVRSLLTQANYDFPQIDNAFIQYIIDTEEEHAIQQLPQDDSLSHYLAERAREQEATLYYASQYTAQPDNILRVKPHTTLMLTHQL